MTTPRTATAIAAAMVMSALLLSPLPAPAAGPFDGSVPLLCAVIESMECEQGEGCEKRTLEEINLPRFLNVDFKARLLAAADDSRSTPIQRVERVDGHVILQGLQGARAWSFAIEEATGGLSAVILDQRDAFTVFGACTRR